MTMTDQKPCRYQRSRQPVYRMPPDTISIARPSKWGNPYPVSYYGRELSLQLFRRYAEESTRRGLIESRPGVNVACFCGPGQACHGDI